MQAFLAGLMGSLLVWGGLVPTTTPRTHHTVFFTAPIEKKVFKIDVDVNEVDRTTSNLVVSLLFEGTGAFAPKDVAFGPDGNLYIICDVSQICRMPQVGGSFTTFYQFTNAGDPTNLGGMRVLGNDLYFTAAEGLFRKNVFDGDATVTKVNDELPNPPAGITVSLTGDLIALDGSSLFRVRRDANKDFSLVYNLTIDGGVFAATTGVAAEPVVAISPSLVSNRKFVTGTRTGGGEAVAVLSCPSPPDTNCTELPLTHVLDPGDEARDIEIDMRGSSFFATQNGKLFRFDPEASSPRAILLADLQAELGDAISGYGVGLPPTSRTDMASFDGTGVQTKRLNCGNSLVDVTVDTPVAGTARLTCQMDLPENLNRQFVGDATDALCTQYDWSGGFCTRMDLTSSLPPSTPIESFFAYVKKDEPLNAQPLVVHDFEDVTITNYYLAGVLAPEDETRGGRGFSTNVLADRPIDDPAGFIGFKGKLSTDRNAPTPVNNQIPVRPQFEHSPREDETLQLSANCEDPFLPINPVKSVGHANDENFFRPTGNHWTYNLDVSNFPKDKLCVLSIWGNVGAFVEGYIIRK